MVGALGVRLAGPLAFAVLRLGRTVEDARRLAFLLPCALRTASASLPVGGGTWGQPSAASAGEGRGAAGPPRDDADGPCLLGARPPAG